jgi:diaminopimelate epimerase
MAIRFYKYHGTGNDFILVDDRRKLLETDDPKTQSVLAAWCDRHTGIGADGLILIREAVQADFEMMFFNSDGRPGSMCGNGGRCAVAFAHRLGIVNNETTFLATDGLHQAYLTGMKGDRLAVSLGLNNTEMPVIRKGHYFVHTGSPHVVVFSPGVADLDVVREGRNLRNSPVYGKEGVNVNFAEKLLTGALLVRTYERGVENETLSCGTGVAAVAIAAWQHFPENRSDSRKSKFDFQEISTRGGRLLVSFSPPGDGEQAFSDIFLHGPAEMVFSGRIQLKARQQGR